MRPVWGFDSFALRKSQGVALGFHFHRLARWATRTSMFQMPLMIQRRLNAKCESYRNASGHRLY